MKMYAIFHNFKSVMNSIVYCSEKVQIQNYNYAEPKKALFYRN